VAAGTLESRRKIKGPEISWPFDNEKVPMSIVMKQSKNLLTEILVRFSVFIVGNKYKKNILLLLYTKCNQNKSHSVNFIVTF